MNAAVTRLLSEAMLLPADTRAELVEAILEHAAPSDEFVASQRHLVTRRMESVRGGTSRLIAAEEAHASILANLKGRA